MSSTVARRWARGRPGKLLTGLAMVGLAMMLTTSSVFAGRTWCRTDPVVVIGGSVADVFISGPPTAPLQVTGPNQIVITVPEGVNAWMLVSDLGFGRGTVVSFKHSSDLKVTDKGIEVRVQAYVPARDTDMPVRVEFAPRVVGVLWPASAEGTANEWITLEVLF